jgi:hypothetical protein
MKLPTGPGAAASDTREIIAQATAACVGVRTLTAEIGVSGSVGGSRMRGRLIAGVAAPSSARIEAVAPFGQPVFIFTAKGDDATLLLPRDERVLEHGKPDQVLEAVAGVPLDAADLRRALTGCPSAADSGSGRMPESGDGADWRLVDDGPDTVYLHRDARSGPWYVTAIVHRPQGRPEWRAEYRDVQNGLPRSVRLAGPPRFDLRLDLSQVETNVDLGDEAFRLEIPPSTAPVTLQELRDAGPLRDKK